VWEWWKAAAGVLILAFAFREIFQDLFHPTRTGSLSDFVGRTLFRFLRRRNSTLSLAGPLSLVVVILCWAFAQAVGFALIYWVGFPGEFQTSKGIAPATSNGFWLMLYFPLQVMTTLGFGDLLPTEKFLQPDIFVPMANEASLEGVNWLEQWHDKNVFSIVRIKEGVTRPRCRLN
jgi:hypothetical protein